MKCSDITLKLSFLAKGELPYEERQQALNHIRQCENCTNEYHQYLKMFYLIDTRQESVNPQKMLTNFSENILKQIEDEPPKNWHINTVIRYTVAAIFLALIILHQIDRENIPVIPGNNYSMTELIEREDWQTILQRISENNVKDELIPVSLLLSKINNIDVEQVNYTFTTKFGKNTTEINELLEMLIKYQRYSERISTLDISNYLKINKGETS